MGAALAQEQADAQLKKSVVAYVRQLEQGSRSQRDEAEKKLETLGPKILPLLPSLNHAQLTAEQRKRLKRLLPKLWYSQLRQQVAGSPIKLPKGESTLAKALETVASQSGNEVTDMRSALNQEPSNPKISFEKETQTSFWKAIDAVREQAGLTYYHFTDDRSVGLAANQARDLPTCYEGAFRFEVKRILLVNDFAADAEPACQLAVDVLVEPRLKPLLYEINIGALVVKDDSGKQLATLDNRNVSLAPDPSSYLTSLSFRFQAPKRDANRLADVSGEMIVWLPAHQATFTYNDLTSTTPVAKDDATLRVQLQGVADDQGVWSVPVVIEQLAEQVPSESYLQAALENEVYLKKKSDGSVFEQNGGLSTFGQEPGKLGVEYLFVDAPGELKDYEFVIKIPTAVTAIPVKYTFKDLPLP